MKTIVIIAIAVSAFSSAASAGQPAGALGSLLAAVPAAEAPQAAPAVPVPSATRTGLDLSSGLADLTAAQADALTGTARSAGFAVFQLDGEKMTSKPELLAYAARTLGLPADMDNWDAMIDYLGDMSQVHHNNRVLIVIRNAGAIRGADPKLYSDLRDVAEDSCENASQWSRSTVTLKFAFVD